MRCCIGIDPGLKGGIAALDRAGNPLGVWPMPVAGGEVHAAGVADRLRVLLCHDGGPDQVRVCLEKVGAMPKQGVSSTFRFGVGVGTLLGVCATLGLGVVLVPPPTWKRRILHGLPHDKDGAIRYCMNRWPLVDLVQPGCRVPHDGIADALCLAEYLRYADV